MSEILHKVIMRRSSLKTKFLKARNSFKAYKKHKNYSSRLYKNKKKFFFRNLTFLNLSFKHFLELIKDIRSKQFKSFKIAESRL